MPRFPSRPFSDLSRSDAFLFLGLLAYLFAQFFIGSDEIYRWVMLLGFLPVALYTLTKNRFSGFDEVRRAAVFPFLAAFLAYALLQSAFMTAMAGVTGKPVLHCVLLGIYLFAVIRLFMQLDIKGLCFFQDFLLALCLVSGLAALAWFAYLRLSHPHLRLSGLGANDNSNLGGFVFAQCGLLAIGQYISERRPAMTSGRRLFLLGTLAVILAFAAATQSKGVIFSFAAALVILLARFGYRRAAAVLAGLMLAGGAVLFFVFIHPLPALVDMFRSLPFGDALYARGGSYRLGIWQRAIELIRLQPVLGYGLGSHFPYKFTHPHNLLLSLWYYLGAVGLTLYGLLAGRTLRVTDRALDAPEKIYYAQFCLMLFGGIADFCEPIHGVSVMWFILWLPFAIFHGLRARPALSTTEA